MTVFARVLDDELHGFLVFACDDSDVSRLSPDVFPLKSPRELNLLVMSKRMMNLRLPYWIEQLMCFAFRSARVL